MGCLMRYVVRMCLWRKWCVECVVCMKWRRGLVCVGCGVRVLCGVINVGAFVVCLVYAMCGKFVKCG